MRSLGRVRTKASASVCPVALVPFSFCRPLERAIPALKRMGYTGVELLLKRADDVSVQLLDGLISKYEMQVSAIGTGLAALDGLSLSSRRETTRVKTVKRVLDFGRLAERFNCWIILGSIKGGTSEPSSMASLEKSVKDLRETRSLIEPLNRYESSLINTASEALELIRRNGVRNFRVLLDTFHMNLEEKSLAGAIRKTGRMLGYLHVADSNRMAPGEGHIQFSDMFRALKEIRYSGYLSAEIIQKPDPETALRKTIRFIRASMGELRNAGTVEIKENLR